MRYVAFGDKQASMLGFGCASVMGRIGRRQSLRAMHAAWDAGITLFDTARSYGYGEAEGLLGEFLQGKRERAVVVTKFGILPSRSSALKRYAKPLVRAALRVAPQVRGLVRRGIAGEMSGDHCDVATLRSSLDESLRQLHTEYVDALLMHLPPARSLQDDALLRAMEDVVREGKVRMLGVAVTVEEVPAWLAAPLQLLQFPINLPGLDAAREAAQRSAGRFVMGNHCFAGVMRSAQATRTLERLRTDSSLDADLREKLRSDSKAALAEIVFGTLFAETKASAVVTSMLQTGHLRANAAAIRGSRFTEEEMSLLRGRISPHLEKADPSLLYG